MFSNVSTVDKRQTSQCWWMHNQLLSQTVRAMCLAYERAAVIHHRASPLADYILLCVRRHVSSFQKLECALATDEGNNTHTHTPVVYAFILHFTRAHSLSLSSSHAELCSLHRLPATDMRNASARDISTLCDTRFGVSCCSTTSTAARCQWIRTSSMP